jgi:hypothetical protein
MKVQTGFTWLISGASEHGNELQVGFFWVVTPCSVVAGKDGIQPQHLAVTNQKNKTRTSTTVKTSNLARGAMKLRAT